MSRPRIVITPASLLGSLVKLFLVVAVVVVLVPPLRQRAAPHVAPVLNPFRRVLVKDHVDRVSRFVEREVRITGRAPQDRDLPHVLAKMFPGREEVMRDPWGMRYYLRRRGDGFHVASAGPDRRRGTRDDVISQKRALTSLRDP